MGLSQLAHLPFAELAYIEQLTRIVQDVLGQALVGVYLFGSAASSGYQPGDTASDLDIAAVVCPLSDPFHTNFIVSKVFKH
jgi:predicted nucleotidyltransferase